MDNAKKNRVTGKTKDQKRKTSKSNNRKVSNKSCLSGNENA